MSNDESTDLLLGLGLSLNQAKVYLAILKLERNYSCANRKVFKSSQGRCIQNFAEP